MPNPDFRAQMVQKPWRLEGGGMRRVHPADFSLPISKMGRQSSYIATINFYDFEMGELWATSLGSPI
jgi:hypothetical protein